MPITGNELRLPKTVIPNNYKVNLKPDLTSFTFEGSVNIQIAVAATCSQIQLNASELEIISAELQKDNQIFIAKHSTNENEEILTLEFAEQLQPGQFDLVIHFTGTLNDK